MKYVYIEYSIYYIEGCVQYQTHDILYSMYMLCLGYVFHVTIRR